MATVLHRTISNPFNTTPGPPTCRLDGPFSFPDHAPDLDTISFKTITQDRSRQPSPASVFSVASAPISRNDENTCPLHHLSKQALQLRSNQTPKSQVTADKLLEVNPKSRYFTTQPLVPNIGFSKAERMPDRVVEKSNRCKDDRIAAQSTPSPASDTLLRAKVFPCTPTAACKPQDQLWEQTIAKVRPLNHSHNAIGTPETGTLSRIRELRQQSTSRDQEVIDVLPVHDFGLVHHQQLSEGSSGFVHSMKTASFTNASFSIFPKSSRMGRSTDSYILHGGQNRHSIDSDRPMSSSSFDDLALRRGFRRQQIIDELIATEESYIADLKALVYLYSTLLASTSSIPNRLRSAVEENIDGILHTHETLLTKLHNARLQAAARRWADTAVPAKLGHYRRSNLRHSERGSQTRSRAGHRQTKSDESSDIHPRALPISGSAEPIDVYEITIIFKNAIKEFSAYEEYCANFEGIGHELQKHMPQLWPTYESGMESLARAVMAVDQRQENLCRGITVSDLLIKPIQRLTKYPLLLEQLLHSTPVADAPGTHTELDIVLQYLRDAIQMVNLARDSQYTRLQIQKRWLLQDRLDLSRLNITTEQFRSLGQIELCGILHITYQTNVSISGGYALCVILDEHLLVGFPVGSTGKFDAIALVQLVDIKMEKPTDGKGLQCASTVFTWKVSFACSGHYHELLLSGCTKTEEDQWIAGLRGEFSQPGHQSLNASIPVATCLALDLKSAGVVFSSQTSLSRESSVQRAATVGGRPSISQVIIRNTHNAQDLNEYRDSTSLTNSINRSQSHLNTKRIPVLEPKRSERTRLEQSISDIWTKDRLPFPGMVGSRGGQIIRASAGTLARKLSLASIHAPFSKGRTSSLSVASRKSHELFNDAVSTFEIRRKEVATPSSRMKPKEIPEVDDMRSVVGRMIGGSAPKSIPGEVSLSLNRSKKPLNDFVKEVGPGDPADVFYEQSSNMIHEVSRSVRNGRAVETTSVVASEAPQARKRRWTKPMSKLWGFRPETKSNIFSSSSGA